MRVSIRRRQFALVAVEVYLPRERPSVLEGERPLILSQQQLRLDVPIGAGLHQQIVVVLHSIQHPGVVCDEKRGLI